MSIQQEYEIRKLREGRNSMDRSFTNLLLAHRELQKKYDALEAKLEGAAELVANTSCSCCQP